MISIMDRPSEPLNVLGANYSRSHTSVDGVGNETSLVQCQIQAILAEWRRPLTLGNSPDFSWIQSALSIFPGISGLTVSEAERYEKSLDTLFTTHGKKTGRNFFKNDG